ncbi:MAG: glycosyltransferase family 4 protein [Flavobacteriales bacterium]|nr:glycosyltransferase family 4 protein [Flavobacteriales bacterium]
MALLINGRYLTRPVTGVERYSDMLVRVVAREWPDSRILVPRNLKDFSHIHGLEVVPTGMFRGHMWEQLSLPRAVGPSDVLICPANTGPLRVKRQAVVIHDLAVIHHPEWFDRRFAAWYRFLLPRLAHNAARVITVSSTSAEDIMNTLKMPGSKVVVVPPFAIERTPLPHSPIDGPFVLVVAGRDPRKGLNQIVAWYASLKNPDFKLVVVGRSQGPFPAFPISRPAAPKYRGIVYRTDADDEDLHALYSHAIALVNLSRMEGFGLPILEALEWGCPVIASDLPVFKKNFGGSLFYLSGMNSDGLSAYMDGLRVPNRRAHFAMRGKLRAAQFTQERMAIALHQALDPLLNP